MTNPESERAILAAEKISAGYGDISVLHEVTVDVCPGEIVALLGRNGAGKSTTLLTLAGVLQPMSGLVSFDGQHCATPAHQRARNGLAFVLEDRGVFTSLTVAQNLQLGRGSVARALGYFPELEPHLSRSAGLLSGGQQQMLAVGRALAGDPKVLLIDELSLGLAPLVIERIFKAIRLARDRGLGVILVEQHSKTALKEADRAYVLVNGRIALEGPASDLLVRLDEIEAAYLGDTLAVPA
jgi:branched-chain amino acid transport system ATP-binding protein